MADQFMLRLPPGWRDIVREEAKKSHRSMNSEILSAIETAMRIKGVQLDTPKA
jgi:predicted HicB family RNase H-like nuclease